MYRPQLPTLARRWSLIATWIRRRWNWLLDIEHPDPAYQVLLRGFMLLLVILLALAGLYSLAGTVADLPSSEFVAVMFVTIVGTIAAARSGGGRVVPLVFAILLALVSIVLYRPDTYITAERRIIIQVGLLPAALIATLFVHPAVGFPIITLMLGGLAYRAWAAGVPLNDVGRFLMVGMLNLFATNAICVIVASTLTRAIRQTTDLAENLELRVAERTAEILAAHDTLEERTEALEQRSAQLLAARNALGQTMRQTAHDVGNLLMARVGELERVERAARAGDLPRALAALASVEASTMTLSGLLYDLRESGTAVDGDLQLASQHVSLVDLSQRVGQELSVQMDRRNIIYTIDAAPDVPFAWCDPQRILRVLLNVVDNAVKYIGQGSRITVHVSAEGERVCWECQDDGQGMAPQDLAQIGREFYRVIHQNGDPGGSGIGLHYCGVILRLSGGDIAYASNGHNQGTRVTITLPRQA